MDNLNRTLVDDGCRDASETCRRVSEGQSVQQRARISKPLHLWPDLEALALLENEIAARRRFIGGSDANVILSSDTGKIRQLWLEKRGGAQPVDLSDKLPVMLGCWTEVFNRHWYEKLSGQKVVRTGESLTCRNYPWRRCTLDGMIEASGPSGKPNTPAGL